MDGFVVGFACVRIVPALADDHLNAELTELYVRPEWRRRGVGRQLVAAAEAYVEATTADRLVLLTGLSNRDAQAFYRALGYDLWAVAMRKEVNR